MCRNLTINASEVFIFDFEHIWYNIQQINFVFFINNLNNWGTGQVFLIAFV